MQIIRTFVPDSLQNYNHLVVCPDTQQAAAVDPFDAKHLLSIAEEQGLTVSQIWITHEHGDHIKDLTELKALTGADVYAPAACQGRFEADVWLQDNVEVNLGHGALRHWLSPGHTPGHGIFLYQSTTRPEDDFIVCGDIFFNAGVGNTYSGDTLQLFKTIYRLLPRISLTTRFFPGHDYLVTNLQFVLHHFPQCTAAQRALDEVIEQTPDQRNIKTLADELKYNPFLALNAPWLTSNEKFDDLNNEQAFLELRKLRNQW
ncbi:MAG: hydroxyacylglutathione hydrolase C-terminal domain-containing protein [Reinekea sp.]|jgi:hydroxyacylglutathione hydrolase